jgi:hypothetical protein
VVEGRRAITDRMADRTSAEIFGWLFEELARLAQSPEPEVHSAAVDLASKAWAKARDHDFVWEQMEADEALVELGLAERSLAGDEIVFDYTGPRT